MTAQAVRATLPAAASSAAQARKFVAHALEDAGLLALRDDALLLVTELVTNSFLHAGTTVTLDVRTDLHTATVAVSDGSRGRPAPTPSDSTRESGRGLLLVDALATAWGTQHDPTGKTVWFRLGQEPTDSSAPAGSAAHPDPVPKDDLEAAPRDIAFLLGPHPGAVGASGGGAQRLDAQQMIEESLRRVVEGLDARRGWVHAAVLDGPDGQWVPWASYDADPGPDADEVRRGGLERHLISLPLHGTAADPIGALVLDRPARDQDADALASLVAARIGVMVTEEQGRRSQLRARGSLALLAEAGEMFAGILDVDLACVLAARLTVPRMASWAAVWTDLDERGALLRTVSHPDEARASGLRDRLSRDDIGKAVAQLIESGGVRSNSMSGALSTLKDAELGTLGEGWVVPLVARGRRLGVLVAAGHGEAGRLTEDPSLLRDLARIAALAIDNARLYGERAGIAAALEDWLRPRDLPRIAGVDLGARYSAAGEANEVGGDFYDVFEVDADTWGICIGDVCGKGPGAAAVTGIAREILRLLTRQGLTPPEVLGRLNETLLALEDRGRFCTAVLGTIARTEDGLAIRYSTAGHPPPLLLRPDGRTELVGEGGTLLGVTAQVELADDSIVLAPGEALVLYTDGITERRGSGSFFGEANLLSAAAAAAGGTAMQIARSVEAAAACFGVDSAVRDDVALLVLRAI
ncbi:MAG: SpoIIE family protein phosphatase [Sporichthyaceae bacterium]